MLVHDDEHIYLGRVAENGALLWCKKALAPVMGDIKKLPTNSDVLGRAQMNNPDWKYLLTTLPAEYSFNANGRLQPQDNQLITLLREAAREYNWP